MYLKFDEIVPTVFILCKKMITTNENGVFNATVLLLSSCSGGHCPLKVSGGILCSERGQSRDAFQATPLEETSPRCNKLVDYVVTAS